MNLEEIEENLGRHKAAFRLRSLNGDMSGESLHERLRPDAVAGATLTGGGGSVVVAASSTTISGRGRG